MFLKFYLNSWNFIFLNVMQYAISEPIGCIRRLTSGRRGYSLWGQTPLFLGYCWRRRISVSDFLLRVQLAVYSLTVYSSKQEWS